MSFRKLVPRLTLSGILTTTALVALALALFATFDRFAILLMATVLAVIAFAGIVWPRRVLTKRYSVTCSGIALALSFYLASVAPAAWVVARCHTLDSGGRPESVTVFQTLLDPAAECWVDSPAPIRAAFMRTVNAGMPSNASLDEYPHGFGYTTISASGGAASVVLANYYRGG